MTSNPKATPLIKGINYDVGTEFRPGELSRSAWNLVDVSRDMAVIHDDLGCNSVNVYGTELSRLEEAAGVALDHGLAVSFQPRSIDDDRDTARSFLRAAAGVASSILEDGDVTLNIGCEMSLFTRGFLPGRTFQRRMRYLVMAWPFLSRVNRRLSSYLAEVAADARRDFAGHITYGAGSWEAIDWAPFDLVGMNLYRDRWNERTYMEDLRSLHTHAKPVVITEFGCATFEGAERRGGGGWTIVDFTSDPPRVRPGHQRSERAQADHLGEMLDLFHEEGVAGTYVFDFLAAGFPHRPEPELDLDMAGYGVVKVIPSTSTDSIMWERKEAFEAVARRYRQW